MKPWRAHLITLCITLASRLAAAQAAPPQGSSAPPGGRAQPAYPMSAAGAAQLGIPPQGADPQATPPAGAPQQTNPPQPPQGSKARGYPQPYDPPQNGALQQPPFGPGFAIAATGRPVPPLNDAGETPDADLGHHGQLNFRAEFLTGYRMLYRYGPSPRCAPYDIKKSSTDQQKFCGYGSAPAVGMAVGFSLIDLFEPFAFIRLGLANEAVETNQGKLLQAGFGARLYTMANSRFKFFFTPWVGVDATSGPLETIGAGPPGSPGYDDSLAKVKTGSYKTDILAHFDLGPQYDFSRGFGMYISGGLTVQMVRYLGTSADVAIGIQARAP